VAATRRPNPRGEGIRLRAEIIAAARRLLERSGDEDALTLRGVAREAGIAAPSIYGHFADRGEVLDAVVADVFGELEEAVRAAAAAESDPQRRVGAVCRAYLDFADREPAGYRVLFGRFRAAPASPRRRELADLGGAGAFGVLADAVAAACGTDAARSAGGSSRAEPAVVGSRRITSPPLGSPPLDAPAVLTTATALWVALHGYATLHASVPLFPWPDDLPAVLVDRLGQLR
jgi:AcrR family transcriptional regulator